MRKKFKALDEACKLSLKFLKRAQNLLHQKTFSQWNSSNVKTDLSKAEFYFPFSFSRRTFRGARWRSGQGTSLQTGRSRVRFPMVSLGFFSDIIIPVAL